MPGSFAASRTGMSVARGLARVLPRALADSLIGLVASRILANPDSALVRASRVNQWVASGGTLAGESLDAAVCANVEMMARVLYDLYHVAGTGAAEVASVVVDEAFEAFVEREISGAGPFVYVGAHFGNFDLVGRALGFHGWRMQVLSVPEPTGAYQWQNELREQAGFEVTPVSIDALKQAARGLANGHSVLTGLDRPLPEPDKALPRFFGRPAPLPLLHVRLAMRAGVPVVVLAGFRRADGRYSLIASDPIELEPGTQTPELLAANAERCLVPVEQWISASPEQWAMPHVVWPDVRVPD
ncbi:MAG: lysophospholipid acyltransferase family protein [Coriobacteriia bacterium]|nr:lysophospholipid acyltransferase family protein [Coriobacteriia bacterium]